MPADGDRTTMLQLDGVGNPTYLGDLVEGQLGVTALDMPSNAISHDSFGQRVVVTRGK